MRGFRERTEMSSVEEEESSDAGLSRTTEMMELCRDMELKRSRVGALSAEHEKRTRRASLLCDANYAYSYQYWSGQKYKENVLIALKSDVVPDSMRWNMFERKYPKTIQNDKEVFMARLELDDFEDYYKNRCFCVPSKFRNDKEVMMSVCSKNPWALEFASTRLKNDRELVLTAIRQKFDFAPFALRFASKKLRGDRSLVRVALNRSHGIRCVKFTSSKLQMDHRLVLTSIRKSSKECSREYEHLSELLEPLLSDEDIVMAAVKKRGSNLRFVSDPCLLEDFDVAMAACKQDGMALQYVPEGSTRTRLLKRKNLRVILSNGGGAMLEHASGRDQMDDNLILLAVQNGLSEIPNLHDMYYQNRPLFMKLIRCSSGLYRNLPEDIKKIPEVGLAVLTSDGSLCDSTTEMVLDCCPELSDNPEAMLAVAEKCEAYFFEVSSQRIRENKTVMAAACAFNAQHFEHCSLRLKLDPDLVLATLTSKDISELPYTLRFIPEQVMEQLLMQDFGIVRQIIESASEEKFLSWLLDYLPLDVFRDRSVLLTYIQCGGAITCGSELERIVKECHSADHEVHLAHLRASLPYFELELAPVEDRDFVEAAIEVEARSIKIVGKKFRDEFDLLLLAIGSSRKTLQVFRHSLYSKDFSNLVEFAVEVRKRLSVADIFICEFLRGIDIVTPHVAPAKRCKLTRLDRGHETNVGFRKLIAEYVGMPLGKELRLLRSALANLEFWGY